MSETRLTAEEYLEISRNDVERALDRVIGDFDFEKASSMLRVCGWKYQGAAKSPSVHQLKKIAKEITMQVMQYGSRSSVSSGPLTAETRHYDTPAVVTVSLTLTPVHSTAVYIDGRVIFAKRQVRLRSKTKPQ